jgi:hypothetical protein
MHTMADYALRLLAPGMIRRARNKVSQGLVVDHLGERSSALDLRYQLYSYG